MPWLLAGALAFVAFAALIANLAQSGPVPRLPLTGLVGPARISELRYAQVANNGLVTPRLAAQMRAAARGEPLQYLPFLFTGAVGGPKAVVSPQQARFLKEALRRNPRSSAARYLMTRYTVAHGQLGEAVANLAVLERLNPGQTEGLFINIGKALTTNRQVDEAVAALKGNPSLLEPVVRGFASVPKNPELVRHLAQTLPRKGLDLSAISPALSNSLLQAGQFAAAREVWVLLNGTSGNALVTDPSFSNAAAQPPFGWDLMQSTTGVAERQPGGGLFVDYYGRKPGLLVRQQLTLAPGSYRATLVYEPQSELTGTVEFSIACGGTDRVLGRAVLDAPTGRTARVQLPLRVDANCPGQSVQLSGILGDRRISQQIAVRRIDIVAGR